MVEPNMPHGGSGRPRLMQRLYWRIYLALLASLTVAAVLFGLAHVRYGAAPAVMLGTRGHLAMLALLLAIAVVVAVAAFPVVRRLTRRLERLQASVDAWGSGDLSSRVAVEGRDEVAQLAMSFNQSAGRIEALMSAQRVLLANASHELRSPLARMASVLVSSVRLHCNTVATCAALHARRAVVGSRLHCRDERLCCNVCCNVCCTSSTRPSNRVRISVVPHARNIRVEEKSRTIAAGRRSPATARRHRPSNHDVRSWWWRRRIDARQRHRPCVDRGELCVGRKLH